MASPPTSPFTIRGVEIDDTFAEAFPMRAARLVVTAASEGWARTAATVMTGFATSVIGCKCEAGIERMIAASETPDARPGVSVLLFTADSASLETSLIERVGQTILTCPTTACYDGLPEETDRMPVGRALRVFGDGFQGSKKFGPIRYWRIPVMDGEFFIQEDFGRTRAAVGGGNFLILAESASAALSAAESAVQAMAGLPGVILPFPGGIVRSGSKVGANRYKGMVASTNDAFAPTVRPITRSSLSPGINGVQEIVLDGLDAPSISAAMRVGIDAACTPGVIRITAGNYGGKLGPHHFPLRQIMA